LAPIAVGSLSGALQKVYEKNSKGSRQKQRDPEKSRTPDTIEENTDRKWRRVGHIARRPPQHLTRRVRKEHRGGPRQTWGRVIEEEAADARVPLIDNSRGRLVSPHVKQKIKLSIHLQLAAIFRRFELGG
jgi:hypothetical protein